MTRTIPNRFALFLLAPVLGVLLGIATMLAIFWEALGSAYESPDEEDLPDVPPDICTPLEVRIGGCQSLQSYSYVWRL